MSSYEIVPAAEVPFDDLETVLGARGEAAKCQCQRKAMDMKDWWYLPQAGRREVMRREHAGEDGARNPGLLLYESGEPVGWVRVGPRVAYPPLRNSPVPWAGRNEDKDDPRVWAIACFVTRAGFRKRGFMRVLASAAIEYTRDEWAAAVEAHPVANTPVVDIPHGASSASER